jgi:WD40 repeat protein
VTSSDDHTTRIWDIRGGPPVAVLEDKETTIYNARFSPDDAKIATASSDGVVKIWDANTGSSISDIKVTDASIYVGAVYKVLFTPSGDRLITATEEGSVRIWDVQTGKLDRTFAAGDTGPAFDVAISADGSRIAVASGDGSARLWEVATGKLLTMLHDGDDPLLAIAMNSLATIAATASWNGTMRVWDLQTGKPLADKHLPAAIFGLAFNPNDRQIASASRDTTARLYSFRSLAIGPSSKTSSLDAKFANPALQNSSVFELLSLSKAAIARCLTRAEREEVFLDPTPPSWCIAGGKWLAPPVLKPPDTGGRHD